MKNYSISETIKKNIDKITSVFLAIAAVLSKEVYDIYKDPEHNSWGFSIFLIIILIIIVLVLYSIQLYIISLNKDEQYEEMFNEQNSKINELINKFQSDSAKIKDWFYSHERLAIVEEKLINKNTTEILVISNNLEYEKLGSIFRSSIESNLKEGIKYKYLIPNKNSIKTTAKSLKNGFGHESNKVDVRVIPEQDFTYPSDIIIFNPESVFDDERKTQIYMELKIDESINDRGWIKIHSSQVEMIKESIEFDLKDSKAL